jgi:Flp pilus assembly protein TadD
MTQNTQTLYRNRSSTREFFLYKTDYKTGNDQTRMSQTGSQLIAGWNELSDVFPDLLAGKSFIESSATRLESFSTFGVMVIRIDRLSEAGGVCGNDFETPPDSETLIEVAKIIDEWCKNENGIWGRLNLDTFGCFFPGKNEHFCLRAAAEIQKALADCCKETFTAGTAGYPTLDFGKSQILENACKALEHASFFGPNSAVCFDAVSLNISGDKRYQEGDIRGAIEEFETGLQIDPSDVNLHNSLGVCYGELGDFEKASEEFETVTRMNANEVMAVYNLGIVSMMTAQKNKALEYFLRADAIADNVFEVAFQTGRLYLELGTPEKAKKFLEKAVSLNLESGSAFRCLGDCYTSINLVNEAIAAYKKAVKQNPNDAASLSALGYLFNLRGENPEIAETFCLQSVKISPGNGLFRHRLGMIYMQQNRFEDALAEFKIARDLGHDSAALVENIENRLTVNNS